MKAKLLFKGDHWEIHLYNSLDELVDRIYITELKLIDGEHEKSKMVSAVV